MVVVLVVCAANNNVFAFGYGGGGGATSTPPAGGVVVVPGGGGGFSWENFVRPTVLLRVGKVLGTSTSATTTCQYMAPHQVIGVGLKNDTEQVKLLQSFLNKEMGTKLAVNGIYGQSTKRVVQNFQKKYKSSILTPWGLSAPTNYVYYTTIKKINNIVCGDVLQVDNGWLIVVPKFLQQFNGSTTQ